MTLPNHFRTLSEFKLDAKTELRISVKNGLEVHFIKSLSKFDSDSRTEIINEVGKINLLEIFYRYVLCFCFPNLEV